MQAIFLTYTLYFTISESAKFWLNVLNDLKNRGVQSVYVFCVDGLTGFREAISSVYPKAQIQRCIIHQIRSSTKFVSYKDIKKLMSDLKTVYQAINEEEALNNLMKFKETWGKTYPSCVKSWEENWDILSTFFAYPAEVRRIIYTTNIIEGLNRQFRSITKTKPSFTNDDSLRKMLYLASKKIVEHWTVRCRNWDQVLNQLSVRTLEKEYTADRSMICHWLRDYGNHICYLFSYLFGFLFTQTYT